VSDGGVPTGVGKTALGVAAVRAAESRRTDRLFNDPYAEAFLAAAPGAFDLEQRTGAGVMASWGAALSSHAVTRTRFFDDYLLAATAGGIGQVVLLGAGLDARAFRLPWTDDVRLFELDRPDVLAFKERVLDRAVPAAPQRYDSNQPLWFSFAGLVSTTGIAFGFFFARLTHGLVRVLVIVVSVVLLVTVNVAYLRWYQRHRLSH